MLGECWAFDEDLLVVCGTEAIDASRLFRVDLFVCHESQAFAYDLRGQTVLSDRCLADVDMMFLVTMANIQGENVC